MKKTNAIPQSQEMEKQEKVSDGWMDFLQLRASNRNREQDWEKGVCYEAGGKEG